MKVKYEPLPAQREVFEDDTTETILHSGGLGCLSSESTLTTSVGLRKISDLHYPFFVLSHYNNQPVWALSTAPFCKGVDILHRVLTEKGEFVAHESHLSFLEDGKCLRIRDLLSNNDQNFPNLLSTNSEQVQSIRFLSARHLLSTVQGSQDDYPAYIYFYGEQLHSAITYALDDSPLLVDALIFFHECGLFDSDQNLVLMAQEHIHQDQQLFQKHNLDYIHLLVVLEAVLEYQDFFSKHLEHTLPTPLLDRQFLSTLIHRLNIFLSTQDSLNTSLSSCKITSIHSEYIPKPFYDCHVFISNSYYANGSFHHNSGKSYNLCMKLMRLSALNKGHAGGLLCPDYKSFKKDIYPTFSDIFEQNKLIKGKHWDFNQTDKIYNFSWNNKPLYIFTAENEIAGPNLGYGGVNEFSLCKWERVNQFLRRVRTKAPHKQKILAGTPEDKHNWVQDFYNAMLEQKEKNDNAFKVVFGDTTENTFLDEGYARTLEQMLDKKALMVFKEGRIMKITGDLFYYSFDRSIHANQEIPLAPDRTVYANLDFNVGRMTCTFAQRFGNIIHFFDEFELLGNSDTIQATREIIKRYGKDVIITIDASGKNRKTSGASDYQLIMQEGIPQRNIRSKRVNPKFRERQLLVCGKFDKNEILISNKCKVLIRDLEQVEQSKLTFEKIKDSAGKLTHSSDTLDYFIDYEFSLYLNKESKTIQL